MHREIPLGIVLLVLVAGACGGDDPPSAAGLDADGDGISNEHEGAAAQVNTDGDAFPDYLDFDSDHDGLTDAIEAGDADLATPPRDTDGDGTPDFRDTDSDGDGIADFLETDTSWNPIDTDGDGTPDHLDLDSDGDTIADKHELEGDLDGDGTPNFRDLDSDNDGIPDAIEAGDSDVETSPDNTDGDQYPDFLDVDSDNDFIADAVEDPNGNGVVDPGESSTKLADTDGDGTPDLVEWTAGSDPNDPNETIPAGDFYFVLPYQGPGAEGPLAFSTNVRKADIFFSVDTTGSFGEEIAAIQAALAGTIVPGVGAVIQDAAFGVGRFEDLPHEPFGLPGDLPYALLQPITTDVALVGAGLDLLPPAAGGLDTPESGYEALYQWATGAGLPDFGYPPFAPPGIGGVGFRSDALPIIVQITDARSHDKGDYAALVPGAHGRDDALKVLQAIGARVLGIDSLENVGTPDDPRAQLEDLAVATGAHIPPDQGTGKCHTGVAGSPRDPVLVGGVPRCPVVFDVLPDGSGLGSLIVDAVIELTTLGTLDISTNTVGKLKGEKNETITTGFTTKDFIKAVSPVPPPPQGSTIQGEVFLDVTPGSTVNFQVQGFNDFQPSTLELQLFAADIEVLGDGVTVLDVRTVYIIVPPTILPGPN